MSREQTVDSRQGNPNIRRTTAKRFEDLEVWKRAHKLVLKIYNITKDYPTEERFGLVSQM